MIGKIIRTQVPLLVTFEDDEVEYMCDVLYDALKMSHEMLYLFSDKEGFYD